MGFCCVNNLSRANCFRFQFAIKNSIEWWSYQNDWFHHLWNNEWKVEIEKIIPKNASSDEELGEAEPIYFDKGSNDQLTFDQEGFYFVKQAAHEEVSETLSKSS